ncbi:hypothetical protein HYV22_03345 [Candidatus Gottesmanbacteria bacterium]|nr:hypothetical protein [Candidatus Gottesmanbacteria bacterium]
MNQQYRHLPSRHWLSNAFPILFLVLIWGIIVGTNAPASNQWLTGWDNVHPEFNFALNAKRAFSALWQSFQGVGLVGGHGYAATLPHTLFLWALSLVLPVNVLRATFTFLMLLSGSIGTYFLTRKLRVGTMGALCAGLYAMLSLGTMQNFAIPLEAFIVHFGLLPWLLFTFWKLLEHPGKKELFWFILTNIAITPAGFIPPLFIVQTGLLLLFGLSKIKTLLLALLVVFCINAYWLIPVVYYTATGSGNYINAYNNMQSTDQFITRNERYGDLANVAIIKGFLFETNDVDHAGGLVKILGPWITQLEHPWVLGVFYASFAIGVLGLLSLLKNHKSPFALGTSTACIVVFTMLATATPPFTWVTHELQSISPIFTQAFRVTFTKFSISYTILLAMLIGVGIHTLRFRIIGAIFVIAIVLAAQPTFAGNFLYKRVRLEIPKAYFELFDYMKTQDPMGRMVNLPQGWNWGWTPYRWGYSGSGFLWYGIEQPIMDRAFDVWSRYNENYYWEIIRALFAKDYASFEQLLDKYNIIWVLFDPSVIAYQHPKQVYPVSDVADYLAQSEKLTLEATFDQIKLYKTNVSLLSPISLPRIGPVYIWTNKDQAFADYGPYISSQNDYDIYYPFRSLFTGRKPQEQPFKVSGNPDGSYTFSADVPKNFSLEAPSLTSVELYVPLSMNFASFQSSVSAFINGELWISIEPGIERVSTTLVPVSQNSYLNVVPSQGTSHHVLLEPPHNAEISVNRKDDSISVTIPKIDGPLSYASAADPDFLTHKLHTCQELLDTLQPTGMDTNGTFLIFDTNKSQLCFDIILNKLTHQTGYLIEIISKNIRGKSLQFALVNQQSRKTEIDLALPTQSEWKTSYVVVPQMQPDGLGYSFKFIQNNLSTNYLRSVRVTPIPFRYLTSLKYLNTRPQTTHSTYVLSQSYDPGWTAWEKIPTFPYLRRLRDHVLLNNWANGWILDKKTIRQKDDKNSALTILPSDHLTVSIFFLPQLLEWIGFLLLPLPFLFLLKKKHQ